jgi:hypothetical protein
VPENPHAGPALNSVDALLKVILDAEVTFEDMEAANATGSKSRRSPKSTSLAPKPARPYSRD